MFDEKILSAFLSCYILGVGSDASKLLDSHLRTILENVRLIYLLEREEAGWDANLNWEDILSLGEQQRLGMVRLNELIPVNLLTFFVLFFVLSVIDACSVQQARLFFQHPKFGILDECTKYVIKLVIFLLW